MFDIEDPRVGAALKQDRARAAGLLATLDVAGRMGHPARDHLGFMTGPDLTAADLATIAAVGFEAGVRVELGALAGAEVAQGARPKSIEAYINERPATGFDADGCDLPYLEIVWRAVVSDRRRAFLDGAFTVPEGIPGAALVTARSDTPEDRRMLLDALLGEPPWDDVLDPVAATGNFLAQAIPDYQDLDLLFRQAREAMRSAAE